MFSLTPFFANPFVAVMASPELRPERDLAHMVNNLTHNYIPDRHGVYHREPNYLHEADDNEVRIEVELPGVTKENVSVELNGHRLVVNAKRFRPTSSHQNQTTTQTTEDVPNQLQSPKPFVVYELKLRVGHKYHAENLQAAMDGHGILRVTIPIKKHTEPQRLISVA